MGKYLKVQSHRNSGETDRAASSMHGNASTLIGTITMVSSGKCRKKGKAASVTRSRISGTAPCKPLSPSRCGSHMQKSGSSRSGVSMTIQCQKSLEEGAHHSDDDEDNNAVNGLYMGVVDI